MKQLILLTILCVISSCGSPTKYRPPIYGHDYKRGEIVAPDHSRISTTSEQFNCFVSVTIDDFKKVALALKKGKFPYHIRVLLEKYNFVGKSKKKIKFIEKENKKGQIVCPWFTFWCQFLARLFLDRTISK